MQKGGASSVGSSLLEEIDIIFLHQGMILYFWHHPRALSSLITYSLLVRFIADKFASDPSSKFADHWEIVVRGEACSVNAASFLKYSR